MRALFAVLVFLSASAFADHQGISNAVVRAERVTNANKTDDFGVGIQAGSLPGVNFEYWRDNYRALDGSVTYDRGNTGLALHHLWFSRDYFAESNLSPFAGIGGLAVFGDRSDMLSRKAENFAAAVQVPLGLEWLPHTQRFSVFGDIAPSMEVIPATVGFLTGDVGARYYF